MRSSFFVWLFVFLFFSSSTLHAAEKTKPSEAKITDASKKTGAPDSKAMPVPTNSIMVIESRLPSDKKNLNEVPSNVSYVGKQELKEKQPMRFYEAVRHLEGATFNDSVGNDWDTSFGLRGFSGSSNINFLVDGVRVNEPDQNVITFPLISMDDLESIQVDRGSASPVHGTQAFAGVVNITTGQPSPKPLKLFGGFEWGSFHSIRFYQGASGTLQDKITSLGGKFKYYFRGGRNAGRGWRNNDDWRITSFDIKTAYELPDEQGRVYVNVKHMSDEISNPGEMTFQQFQDDFYRVNKPRDGRDFRNTIVQIGADKKFLDDKITASIMSSWRPSVTRFRSTAGTFVPFFAPSLNPYTQLARTNSQDQNLTGQIKYEDYLHEDIFNETLFGMEFRDQSQNATLQDTLNGVDVDERAPLRTKRNATLYNTGLFWRETLKFWDKIAPYFGMRHDWHWLKTHDFLVRPNSVSQRWQKTTLSTGVNITPFSFSDFFFNYSQGFRVPSISDLNPFSGTISTTLQPEKSDSYEVGTRLRYKELAAYKASLFFIDLEDEISFDSAAISALAPFGQNINIGASRRYGLEQRLDLQPIDELKLYGSATLMRAYVRDTNTGNSPVSGRDFGQIPEVRFTWGTSVTPLKSLGEPYDGLRFALNGVFTGHQHPSSYESATQATLNATGGAGHIIKSYTVWDSMISYEWREKMVYFKINNLFDEKYYTRAINVTSFGTAIYPAGTFTFVNPGAPREFLVGTRWEI